MINLIYDYSQSNLKKNIEAQKTTIFNNQLKSIMKSLKNPSSLNNSKNNCNNCYYQQYMYYAASLKPYEPNSPKNN